MFVAAILLGVVLLINGFFVFLYFSRLRTYDDGYHFYRMDIKYDYDLDKIINYRIKDTRTMVEAVTREALPLIPV